MTDFRLPLITANDLAGQTAQLKSYLYQLVEQLNATVRVMDSDTVTLQKYVERAVGEGTSEERAVSNFNSIKALIIKSADIVNAYYDRISASMEGNYEALSDFGTFKEVTRQDIEANSTGVTQLLQSIQELTTEVDGMRQIVSDAYIRSGQLGYDAQGIPIVGLEIGQKTRNNGAEVFNRFARFTSGKLSFYDANNTEVAYISDYKLYITEAVVRGSLSIGGYVTDTTYGLAFFWG